MQCLQAFAGNAEMATQMKHHAYGHRHNPKKVTNVYDGSAYHSKLHEHVRIHDQTLHHTRFSDAHDVALEKTPGVGSRIDIALTRTRIGFFFGDNDLISTALARAEELVEKGGDWDRRNRLKVYQGLHALSIRQFARGAELFIDALSTFTATVLS